MAKEEQIAYHVELVRNALKMGHIDAAWIHLDNLQHFVETTKKAVDTSH